MIYLQAPKALGVPTDTLSKIESAAQATLSQVRSGLDAELTVVLSDDARLHALNLQFLGVNAPTDILSFPADELDPDSQILYLGDVVISYPRAKAQAAAGGHPVFAELQLLTVHGVLHLLGYDHAGEADQAAMWSIQAAILTRLGCPITTPSTG